MAREQNTRTIVFAQPHTLTFSLTHQWQESKTLLRELLARYTYGTLLLRTNTVSYSHVLDSVQVLL